MSEILTSERLDKVVLECLFHEGENTDDALKVEMIVNDYGFHPVRVQEHREEIVAMLDELPDEFKLSTGGGGWTFLNACNTKDGEQWTGLHKQMEALFALGIAVDYVSEVLPRALWEILPGGMPYYQILDKVQDNAEEKV